MYGTDKILHELLTKIHCNDTTGTFSEDGGGKCYYTQHPRVHILFRFMRGSFK